MGGAAGIMQKGRGNHLSVSGLCMWRLWAELGHIRINGSEKDGLCSAMNRFPKLLSCIRVQCCKGLTESINIFSSETRYTKPSMIQVMQ